MSNAAAIDPDKARLLTYKETRYNSGNKELQKIFKELEESSIEKDNDIYELIKTNKWVDFDQYIIDHPGKKEFYRILQQLFLYYYFDKESDKITRKQLQNALGIQQTRWMMDDDNCKVMKTTLRNSANNPIYNTNASGKPLINASGMPVIKKKISYEVKSAKIYIWETIPEDIQTSIKNSLHKLINKRIYSNPEAPETTLLATDLDLTNTIWYKVITDPIKGAAPFWGYGPETNFYAIPETYNFSKIACIYTPVLIFGSLSEQSLLKYIINNNERPYAMHAPDAKSNLCEIHKRGHMITANWKHDFLHSSMINSEIMSSTEYTPGCKTGFENLNTKCDVTVNQDNIKEEINNPDSKLSKCIYDKTLVTTGDMLPYAKGDMIARLLNDFGKIWSTDRRVPIVEGGTRRRKFQHKKSKSRKRHTKRITNRR